MKVYSTVSIAHTHYFNVKLLCSGVDTHVHNVYATMYMRAQCICVRVHYYRRYMNMESSRDV